MNTLINRTKEIEKELKLRTTTIQHVDVLIRLMEKTEENNIQSIELNEKFDKLVNLLEQASQGDRQAKKTFNKTFQKLAIRVHKDYGLVEKGWYRNIFTGIGLSLGLTIGILLIDDSSTGVALGLSLGLAIGVSFGIQQDKSANKSNKAY